MNMIFRLANTNDLQGILDIYNDAIVNTTAVYDYKPHTLQMRREWFDDKSKKGIPVFIAEVGSTVAGFASYGPFRAWPAYKYSIEHSVYVHRDFRNRGIAKKLLQELIDDASHKDIHTVIAGIDASNAASIHLHRQFGFVDAGYFKQVGYKFGRWLDLQFLQLILQNNIDPNESV